MPNKAILLVKFLTHGTNPKFCRKL